MASQASGPSRASMARRPPSWLKQPRIKIEWRKRGAGAPAAGSLHAPRDVAPRARRRAPRRASRDGRGAIARRSSSSSPTSGDFSTAASVRSSCGRSAARPAAIRSITAIWSKSSSRSAPATGTLRCFKARITASKKALRVRTRIRMSPALTGRKRCSPRVVHIFARARRDERGDLAGDAVGKHRRGIAFVQEVERQAPVARLGSRFDRNRRPNLDEPREIVLQGVVPHPGVVGDEAPLMFGMGKDLIDRGEDRRHGAERRSSTWTCSKSAGVAAGRGELARASRETCAAPRPGRKRSTVSRRRPRRKCAAKRRLPAPAKNSAVKSSRIFHCGGLVSCASSTRI